MKTQNKAFFIIICAPDKGDGMEIIMEKKDTEHDLPTGLAFSMAMNERALTNYGKMTEEQRRAIITESKLAKSKDEMSQLVDRIASHSFQ